MCNELKPCPFCNEAAQRLHRGGAITKKVSHCCPVIGMELRMSEQAWNTRAERKIGISKFQKITGTSYIEAKSILSALEQSGAKVVEV